MPNPAHAAPNPPNAAAEPNVTPQDLGQSAPQQILMARLGLVERHLSVGDRIQLSATEFFDTMYTFYRFALELLQVVERRLEPGNG